MFDVLVRFFSVIYGFPAKQRYIYIYMNISLGSIIMFCYSNFHTVWYSTTNRPWTEKWTNVNSNAIFDPGDVADASIKASASDTAFAKPGSKRNPNICDITNTKIPSKHVPAPVQVLTLTPVLIPFLILTAC